MPEISPALPHSGSRQATVAIPGTCGELVQGLVDGTLCLVSCPIDRYVQTSVTLRPAAKGWQTPPHRPKVAKALRLAAERLGLSGGGELRLSSDLPDSKGYGSSTADIASAVYALGRAAGRPFDAPEVAQMAVQIEPSDSVMFEGLAMLAHRTGERYESLGEPPPLDILLLDTGGTVDTLAFNRALPWDVLKRGAPRVREALAMLRDGIRQSDAGLVAQAATLSAQVHQAVLPKPALDDVLAAGLSVGALGVCVAHSGTLIGVLFGPLSSAAREAHSVTFRTTREGAEMPEVVGWTSLVGGGPRLPGT